MSGWYRGISYLDLEIQKDSWRQRWLAMFWELLKNSIYILYGFYNSEYKSIRDKYKMIHREGNAVLKWTLYYLKPFRSSANIIMTFSLWLNQISLVIVFFFFQIKHYQVILPISIYQYYIASFDIAWREKKTC